MSLRLRSYERQRRIVDLFRLNVETNKSATENEDHKHEKKDIERSQVRHDDGSHDHKQLCSVNFKSLNCSREKETKSSEIEVSRLIGLTRERFCTTAVRIESNTRGSPTRKRDADVAKYSHRPRGRMNGVSL